MIRAVDFAGQSCCLTLMISSALGAVPQSSIEKTLPRMDKNHPLKIGAQYYPPESIRLGERGMCLVRVEIDADGVIRAMQLISATGFGRLDAACLSAVMNAQLKPATAAGKPVFFWLEIPIYWTLGGLRGTSFKATLR
jgi:TonB family protein